MTMINQEHKLMNIDPELVIGTREAARLLGVSERAVRGLIARGTIPSARYGGKYYLHRGAVEFYRRLRELRKSGASPHNMKRESTTSDQRVHSDIEVVPAMVEPPEFNHWPPVYPTLFMGFWRQSNENSLYGIRFKRKNNPVCP